MKVVLDTNILIAAFAARGTCHDLFEHVALHHALVLSEHILEEFARNLPETSGAGSRDTARAVRLVAGRARIVIPTTLRPVAGVTPDDLPVLGTAAAASAHVLVTGDQALRRLRRFRGTRILPPAAFWPFEAGSGGILSPP